MNPTRRRSACVRLGLLALVVVTVFLVVRRERPGGGFKTAADCLDAYCDAASRGDVAAYLACLDVPLREQLQRRFPSADDLAAHLRRETQDLKSWVQLPESDNDPEAYIAVEEVRSAGKRRVRYRLVRAASTWRIAAIEAPRDVPTVVPYGTPVSDT
jgi:hypothetical protein